MTSFPSFAPVFDNRWYSCSVGNVRVELCDGLLVLAVDLGVAQRLDSVDDDLDHVRLGGEDRPGLVNVVLPWEEALDLRGAGYELGAQGGRAQLDDLDRGVGKLLPDRLAEQVDERLGPVVAGRDAQGSGPSQRRW
jgi:hypothetical protein